MVLDRKVEDRMEIEEVVFTGEDVVSIVAFSKISLHFPELFVTRQCYLGGISLFFFCNILLTIKHSSLSIIYFIGLNLFEIVIFWMQWYWFKINFGDLKIVQMIGFCLQSLNRKKSSECKGYRNNLPNMVPIREDTTWILLTSSCTLSMTFKVWLPGS